ncbi:DUF3866 family protein [Tepidibacillus marianensis]|uniref:DUF3866 family protein n=1 Tax=Tepidibacillus marianensis TaxID=3131995 RepID=UPI0030CFD805
MIRWGWGEVIEIVEMTEMVQVVKIHNNGKENKAIHYLQFGSPLHVGDEVILNQTATELQLGTGGYDFVVSQRIDKEVANRSSNQSEELGHIMKLRYTPYQFSVLSCEEEASPYHSLFTESKDLEGLPVLIGELHSMLPILVTIIRQLEKKDNMFPRRIVYIMTDGGSLPISISQHVTLLKENGWLDSTITVGHSFGGDLEAINVYTGLIAAKHILKADLAIVLMGPGIVGTGTRLGHSGIEHGEIINAVNILKGIPVSIIRAGESDHRERHQGISHHSKTSLQWISLTPCIVPCPKGLEQTHPQLFNIVKEITTEKHELVPIEMKKEEIVKMIHHYSILITTMGKTIQEEPLFFEFVASSAIWVHQYLKHFTDD